jgi:hypothetical protein
MRTERIDASKSQSAGHTDTLLWSEDPDALGKVLSAANVLPENYFDFRARLNSMSPEAGLMCAVLENALDCFQNPFPCRKPRRAIRLAREAREWFFSDDSRWIFSFVSICTALNLDPGYIRQGLKASKECRENRPLGKELRFTRTERRRVA